jgi:16S rRNA processing protein RimM
MPLANEYAPPPDWHYLGKFGRTSPLAGGLRVYPVGDREADALETLEHVFVAGFGSSRVREVRSHGGELLLYLTRVQSRDQAQRLVNAGVYADPASLPEAPEDSFYYDELIGAPVVLQRTQQQPADGAARTEPLGEVSEILSSAGHDMLVVAGTRGQIMLPLQAPYVEFDGERVTVVDPPEGLLD